MPNPAENGLFNTPDYLEDESFPPLPPPLSPGEGHFDPLDTGDGEMGEMSKLPDVPVAKRRTVKKPQPKLDSMRLLSDRGLPALRTLFADVKFKGKGHEAEDLKVLMRKMENWAHRLYPKLQFEDFIDRLEVLGGKKEVQTCLKRIRLDMPLTHEDYGGNNEHAEAEGHRQEDEDLFADGFSEVPFIHSTPAPAPVTLTEEQQQRIERNKQLALEKRLARQKQMESSQSTVTDNLITSPSAHELSQDNNQANHTDLNQSLAELETPQKQKTVVSQSTPLNESSTSGPRLTNGIIDDSDHEDSPELQMNQD